MNKSYFLLVNALFLFLVSIGYSNYTPVDQIPIVVEEIIKNSNEDYSKYAAKLENFAANSLANYFVDTSFTEKQKKRLTPIIATYLQSNFSRIQPLHILELIQKFNDLTKIEHRLLFNKIKISTFFDKAFYEALIKINSSLLWDIKEQSNLSSGIIQSMLLKSSDEEFLQLIEKYKPDPASEQVPPALLVTAIELRKTTKVIRSIINKWPELLHYRSPACNQSAINVAILYNNEEVLRLILAHSKLNKSYLDHVLSIYLICTPHFNDKYFNNLIKRFPESATKRYATPSNKLLNLYPFERLIIARPNNLNLSLETLYRAYPEAAKSKISQSLSAINSETFIPFAEKHADLIKTLVQDSKIKVKEKMLDEETLLEVAIDNSQIRNANFLLENYPELLQISSSKEKNLAESLVSHFIREEENIELLKIIEREDFSKFFLKRGSYGAYPAIAAAQIPLYLSATLKAAKRENINFYSLLSARDFVNLFSLGGLPFSLKIIQDNKSHINKIKKDLIPHFFNNGQTLHTIAMMLLKEDESLWEFIDPSIKFDPKGDLIFQKVNDSNLPVFYSNLLNLYKEPRVWKLLTSRPEHLKWLIERKAHPAFAYYNAPFISDDRETRISVDLSLKNFRTNTLQQMCHLSKDEKLMKSDLLPLEEWSLFFEELAARGLREEETMSEKWKMENIFLTLEEYMLTLSLFSGEECQSLMKSKTFPVASVSLLRLLDNYTNYMRTLFKNQDERIQHELMLTKEDATFSDFLDWQLSIAPPKKAQYLEKLRFGEKSNKGISDSEAGLRYLQAFQKAIRKSFKKT